MPLQCRTPLRATSWPCQNASSLGSAYDITCVAQPSQPSKPASHLLLVFILQKMLFWGYKAEIEILGEMLEEWVIKRIAES